MDRIKFFNIENIHLLWILIPIILLFRFSLRRRFRAAENFISVSLHSKLIPTLSKKKIFLKKHIAVFSLILLIFALTGPMVGSKLVKVKREGIDIVMAVDLSRSMLAEDIKPNRLKKTKHEVKNFINGLNGDRISLVGFTSSAFIQCPLTSDYDAALMFLDIMDTSLLPQGGTSLAEAVRVSASAFSDGEKKHKLIIIVSDGEDHEKGISEAVEKAREKGIVIYTIGIGSQEGVPIPTGNGFLKDTDKNTVISKLNETDLKKIASEGEGNYYASTPGENELSDIFEDIGKIEKKEFDERTFKDHKHVFQIFLIAALILLFTDLLMTETRIRKETKNEI